MTENEAIEELKYDYNELGKAIPCDTSWGMAMNEAYGIAISALREIQQYRSMGTVSECREAVEKQRAKKPITKPENQSPHYDNDIMIFCPTCRKILRVKYKERFCCGCGQKLDWSDTH